MLAALRDRNRREQDWEHEETLPWDLFTKKGMEHKSHNQRVLIWGKLVQTGVVSGEYDEGVLDEKTTTIKETLFAHMDDWINSYYIGVLKKKGEKISVGHTRFSEEELELDINTKADFIRPSW